MNVEENVQRSSILCQGEGKNKASEVAKTLPRHSEERQRINIIKQGWVNIRKLICILHHTTIHMDRNHMVVLIDAEQEFDKLNKP